MGNTKIETTYSVTNSRFMICTQWGLYFNCMLQQLIIPHLSIGEEEEKSTHFLLLQ